MCWDRSDPSHLGSASHVCKYAGTSLSAKPAYYRGISGADVPPLPYEKGPSDPNTFRVISQMSWRPCFCFFFYKTLHSTTGPRPSPRTMGVGPPRAGQPGGTRLAGKWGPGEVQKDTTNTTILLYTTSHASGELDSCTQATQRVGTKTMW